MKKLAFIWLMIFFLDSAYAYAENSKESKRITKDEAVEIAKAEIARHKDGIDKRELTVTYNIRPADYFDIIQASNRYSIEFNELENRNYWAVCYHPNEVRLESDVLIVYVDADTGEIISYYRNF